MNGRRVIHFQLIVLAGMLSVLLLSTGCSLAEAIMDGFFGGISDVVSATVADAINGVDLAP